MIMVMVENIVKKNGVKNKVNGLTRRLRKELTRVNEMAKKNVNRLTKRLRKLLTQVNKII